VPTCCRFCKLRSKGCFRFNLTNSGLKHEENRLQYESEAKWKQIISFGAALTIFISCIGLFGLSMLAAEKRTKEIGIRKVLGASVAVITRTLSTDFLKLVLLAALVAIRLLPG
jgi:putative ABC transport system permease protein